MWAGIVAIIPLLLLIFQEFFSATARAREEKKEFKLTQEAFRLIVQAALERQLRTMAKESAAAGNAWDSADGDKK